VYGETGTGNWYECIGGQWVEKFPCIAGGYAFCNMSATDCAGFYDDVVIADKGRNPNRISIYDNFGRAVPSYNKPNETVHYYMFHNQNISEIAFRYLWVETFDDRIFTSGDTVSIGGIWNATEMTCNKTAGESASSSTTSFYYDKSAYSCTLLDGYDSSNLTIQINASLASGSTRAVSNPVLSNSFDITFLRDVALMDNFQVVWVNESHIAFSGRIIRLSDLAVIPQSRNPSANITSAFFSKYNSVYISGHDTGQLNATDVGNLYNEFLYSSVNPGDVFFNNITVQADNYSSSSYVYYGGEVASQRVLSFKCRNIPKNTTYYTDKTSLIPVVVECNLRLANASYPLINIISNASVTYQDNLANSLDVAQLLTGLTSIVPVDGDWNRWRTMNYSGQSGYTLTYKDNSSSYQYISGSGVPLDIIPTRYVGQWGLLDHPDIPLVRTHLDLTVDRLDMDDAEFYGISFDKTTYYQNDTVVCTTSYFDPQSTVKDWSVEFYSNDGYSYVLHKRDLDNNNSCFDWDSETDNARCIYSSIYTNYETHLQEMVFWINGVQKCRSKVNGTDICNAYNWKFIEGKSSGLIHCKVTLYRAGDYEGSTEFIADATLMVDKNETDWIGYWTRGFAWWQWIILILFLILLVLGLFKIMTRGGG